MSTNYLFGVDVGGTKVEVALLKEDVGGDLQIQDKSGKERAFSVVQKKRHATERDQGYQHIVSVVAKLLADVAAENSVDSNQISSVGFGLPGSINPRDQKMINGNTLVLVGHNVAEDVKSSLGWSADFYSENDANCFALAEALCGAGRTHFKNTGINFRDALGIGIILGTGCGGGIVIRGQMVRGRDGGAGEIGHMAFDPDGPPCYCGRNGCPEQFLSGPALEALFATRKPASMKDIFSSKDIFTAAAKNEPIAAAVIQEYKRTLGKFIGSLNSIFNPDFFVLGGGVSTQSMIYEGLPKLAFDNSYVQTSEISIYQSALGDSSGVLGAAFLPYVD